MTRAQRQGVGVLLIIGLFGFVWWSVRKQKAEQERLATEAQNAKAATEVLKPVVFARKDIDKRKEIVADMVEIKKVAPQYVPAMGTYDSPEKVAGMVTLTNIYAGEMIFDKRVASKESIQALSFLIDKGTRAVTVEVATKDAVGGFLRKGNLVDVNATIRNRKQAGKRGADEWLSKPVLRGAKILAVNHLVPVAEKDPKAAQQAPQQQQGNKKDQQADQRDPYRSVVTSVVTFQIKPEEVERLVLASEVSRTLQLALRSPVDDDKIETEAQAGAARSVTVEAFFRGAGGAQQKAPTQDEDAGRYEMIKGKAKQYQSFQ